MRKIAFGSKLQEPIVAVGLPLSITISYAILWLQGDLGLAFPTLAGVTAFIVMLLAMILYTGEKNTIKWSPGLIFLVAAVLRILFVVRPPELSDDLYRYLWDGLQVLGAHNPYTDAPINILAHSNASHHLLRVMNHPELTTIYPPAAQVIFAAGTSLGGGFAGFKFLLAAMDLATCALIVKLLSNVGLPAWRAILYAWHPLPILEIASSGHIDGAAIFFFFLTLAFLSASRGIHSANPSLIPHTHSNLKQSLIGISAGFTFGMAALVKLFPLLLLPGVLMLVRKGHRVSFLIGIMSGMTVLCVPFLPQLKNMLAALELYFINWEFSGFGFRTLRGITSSGNAARVILASFFIILAAVAYGKLIFRLYPGPGCKIRGPSHDAYQNSYCTIAGRDFFLTIIKTLYIIIVAFLVATPTLYPWYALYLVCLFPFTPGVGGIVFSGTIFLSYRVLPLYKFSGQWIENDYTAVLIWLVPVLALILFALMRKPVGSVPATAIRQRQREECCEHSVSHP
jgi:hypothetical protein